MPNTINANARPTAAQQNNHFAIATGTYSLQSLKPKVVLAENTYGLQIIPKNTRDECVKRIADSQRPTGLGVFGVNLEIWGVTLGRTRMSKAKEILQNIPDMLWTAKNTQRFVEICQTNPKLLRAAVNLKGQTGNAAERGGMKTVLYANVLAYGAEEAVKMKTDWGLDDIVGRQYFLNKAVQFTIDGAAAEGEPIEQRPANMDILSTELATQLAWLDGEDLDTVETPNHPAAQPTATREPAQPGHDRFAPFHGFGPSGHDQRDTIVSKQADELRTTIEAESAEKDLTQRLATASRGRLNKDEAKTVAADVIDILRTMPSAQSGSIFTNYAKLDDFHREKWAEEATRGTSKAETIAQNLIKITSRPAPSVDGA